MTEAYCRSCYRTLPEGRDLCASCDRQIAEKPRMRIGWLLAGVAVTLMILGMIGFNHRLVTLGGAVAGLGVVLMLVAAFRA